MKTLVLNIFILAILLMVSGNGVPVLAQGVSDDAVSPEMAIPLFLKIITYDQSFNEDSIEAIIVYMVYAKSATKSYEQMLASRDYFKSKKALEVRGVPVYLKAVSADQFKDSLDSADENEFRLAIFTNIEPADLQKSLQTSRATGIPSFAFDPSLLDQGVSVSVLVYKNKARILVNLESAQLERVQYSAHLLKVSELHKKADYGAE